MLNPELVKEYHEAKKSHFSPYCDRKELATTSRRALEMARARLRCKEIRKKFDDLGGYICGEYDAPKTPEDSSFYNGELRLKVVADEWRDLDDLFGDSYNPEACPEIKPEILAKERQHEIDRIERDGIWGVVAEVWDGYEWEHCDSCWGFVGDDWKSYGEETGFMESAIDRLEEIRQEQAREYEESRPDMYGAC
jgi:hypothetical protein